MKTMATNIFEKTEVNKPYTYPSLIENAYAIHSGFWTPFHFTYDRDVQDYKVNLTDNERLVLKRLMLAIAQVENKVKTFWARLDQRMPKTEIAMVGYAFANSEIIHQMTYEKLLELLGLEDEFSKIDEIPCMKGRTEYLGKYLEGITSHSNKEFTKSLMLFTLIIENTSLFAYFLGVSSFRKYRNVLSNFSSVIGATAREEVLHFNFGASLLNIIKEENPDWFDDEMESKIRRNIVKAYEAEIKVIDWVFEEGELSFLPKVHFKEYIKDRFNIGLNAIGYSNQFEVDEKLLEPTEFLNVQITSTASFDFFNEKSTDYKMDVVFDENDLF